MIQEFYVKNFMSIKDKQGISFVANRKLDIRNREYMMIPVSDNLNLLKIGLLYGANASGKTNIIAAVRFLIQLITTYPSDKDRSINSNQFALSDQYRKSPTEFEITFITEAGRYIYYLSLNSDTILNEVLKIYPYRGKKSTVFSRSYNTETDTSEISFSSMCGFSAKDKHALTANTLNNATLFASYQNTNVNSDIISDALSFFRTGMMNPIMPETDMLSWSLDRLENNNLSKKLMLSLMEKADLQISDIRIIRNSMPAEVVQNLKNQGMKDDVINAITQRASRILAFTHHTESGDFELSSEYESRGTLRYFGLAAILCTLISNPSFLCIDEIEASLHPELIDFFLQMFLINSPKSQVFATTHNISLMDKKYFRHDNFWFCEKQSDGSSEYFSLMDFGIHNELKISNIYKAGKIGALPDLPEPALL